MISRISLILSVLFFLTYNMFGQFSFGGKLGGASTSLTTNNLENFVPTPKVKLLGGGIVNYSFGKRLALQAEILYSGKGAAFAYTIDNSIVKGEVTMEQKLGYIAVPFLLQFKLGDRSSYFHIDAGIVSNSLVYEKYSGSIIAQKANGDTYEENYDPIESAPNSHDLGYAFGIGLYANGLNFDFRYEIGTKKVYEREEGAPDVLNKSFQVCVGYTIRY